MFFSKVNFFNYLKLPHSFYIIPHRILLFLKTLSFSRSKKYCHFGWCTILACVFETHFMPNIAHFSRGAATCLDPPAPAPPRSTVYVLMHYDASRHTAVSRCIMIHSDASLRIMMQHDSSLYLMLAHDAA